MLKAIKENQIIDSLAGRFHRSPQQLNLRHESDAEIVRLSHDCTLAVTTDSLAEEIASGLYSDPHLIGWMTVTVSMSDLAAVGAHPVGILISETLTDACTGEFLNSMHRGIHDACCEYNTFVLGGDINHADRMNFTGTAIGTLPWGKNLSRRGCKPGDFLFASNPIGRGNAFALVTLSESLGIAACPQPEASVFKPSARLKEGKLIRDFATSCMDTSDGVLAALDQMMRLSHAGFALNSKWDAAIDPWSQQVARESGIPTWFLLAGPHGEFELLFTIPEERVCAWLEYSSRNGFYPILLGQVIQEPVITLPLSGVTVPFDSGWIRNCAYEMSRNPRALLRELFVIDDMINKGGIGHAGNRNV